MLKIFCLSLLLWDRMMEDVMNVDDWGLIIKVMVDICNVMSNFEDYL